MALETYIKDADIVIGAILIPGDRAPKLIRRDHLKMMNKGAVLVDVAIDQVGRFETSHPTNHADPVFIVDSIIHYCVANMPGAYVHASTYALNNAAIGYGLQLANKGAGKVCRENPALLSGLNAYKGAVTFPGVAEAFVGFLRRTPLTW
jgi:alanine dehydrogenase